MRFNVLPVVALFSLATAAANAQLTRLSQFSSGSGCVGVGVDTTTAEVYTYPSFGASILRFSTSGVATGGFTRPGGAANDADVEIASVPLTLGTTAIPAGSVLYIDGESGVAEIYALTPSGTLLGSLTTAFGVSHVVGGGYHPGRATFFLVQDGVPGGAAAHRVAEIHPVTGAVLQTWQITAVRPTFTVNFGDLDVGANGNLFIVSSDELSVGEFTPTGAFVAEHALPSGVTGLCGIGMDPASCEAWVINTSGVVTHLSGFPSGVCPPVCDPDVNQDGNVDQDDITYLINVIGGGGNPAGIDPDFNHDGNADQDDVTALINTVGGGGCP